MQESVYKQRVTPRRLPADAPNILIVFIDDAGPPFGEVRQRSANPDESTALSTAARRVSRHNLHGRLDVWSQPLMGHPYRVIRRMRYGPDSAWERHNGCVPRQAFRGRHGV